MAGNDHEDTQGQMGAWAMSAAIGGFLIGLVTGGWTMLIVMCVVVSGDERD